LAASGGSHFDPDNPGNAYSADLQKSLASVLYQFVSASLLVETCDYSDNDCDCVYDPGNGWNVPLLIEHQHTKSNRSEYSG